jgi:hypothetical protein
LNISAQQGYFILDDRKATLENQLRQEKEKSHALELECAQLRSQVASGLGAGPIEGDPMKIQDLLAQLRTVKLEREEALRQAGVGGGGNDPEVFEPTRNDFRVLVYRERYDENNVMGELILKPECTFQQVRVIISDDLGQIGPMDLIHGNLGDPLGRSGNLLGPELDSESVGQVFRDHDSEMLIVQASESDGRLHPHPTKALSHADVTSSISLPTAAKVAATTSGHGAQDGAAVVLAVPVYWNSYEPANHKGTLPIYGGDTIGDVRARLVEVSTDPLVRRIGYRK